jgi:sugar O-acyltransferase (sialic acid O-acetyltransferase NeuD family)
VVAFTVDAKYLNRTEFLGLPVVPFERIQDLCPPSEHGMFVAIGYEGMNKPRAEKYREAKSKGYKLATYVSSKCTFLTENPVGDNCLIMEDNTIQPFVTIGNDVVMWSGNHIGHEAVIEDHCFITSHVVISGFVHVSSYCFIGVNATLRDGIKIAPETLVGAGAIIMKDTIEKGVYVPEKAKLSDRKSDEIRISR